ncbi:MAG: hypothetical protein JSV38_07715, partial [Desulfobacterales bacterium]
EIVMYVDYFEKIIGNRTHLSDDIKTWCEFKNNLEAGLDLCQEIAKKEPYKGENLDSLHRCVKQQRSRLQSMISRLTN